MRSLLAAGVIGLSMLGSAAYAVPVTHTFDLTGVEGTGGFFDEFPSLFHNFGEAGTVTAVDFNLSLTAFSPSWVSEAIIFVDGSSDGLGDFDAWISGDYGAADAPGTFSYADAFAVDIDSPTGYVAITAADAFEDAVTPNHIYLAGSYITVTFTPVPEPMSAGVVTLAAAMFGRRRRA